MSIKRFELHIEYRHEILSFRLFELIEEEELATGERGVPQSVLLTEADSWRKNLSVLEERFEGEYSAAYKRSSEAAKALGKTGDDIQTHVLSDSNWIKEIRDSTYRLVDNTGRYINYFSETLLNSFLPLRNDDFWKVFNDYIDTPTREAFRGELKETQWLNVPLLQLRVEKELVAIPWWITRTHDLNSLWCCRYALAVSPSLGRTKAPNIKCSAENPLHILTVTRPTSDLKAWLPITEEIAKGFSDDGRFRWRLVDGVLELDAEPLPEKFAKTTPENQPMFHGVDKNLLERALHHQDITPNFIFYQGHWHNQWDEQTKMARPLILLHDPRPTATTSIPSVPSLPVPLLDILRPKDYAESVLIMNACNSAAPLDQATYIQDYIDQHSVFIGANYPLVAYVEESSISILLRNIVDNKHLAHSLLEANRIEKNPTDKDFDPRELYYKAALCLFGDVRAHLFLEWNATANDNVTPIVLVVTDRWREGLKRLNLSPSRGLTFRTGAPIDHAPTDKFALDDEGVQIALTPLSTAINLCKFGAGKYKILGPAFTSKDSVTVVSSTIKDIAELSRRVIAAWEDNQSLQVGVLTETLTTTFMLQQFILDGIFPLQEKPAWLVPANLPKLIEYHPAFSEGTGSRDEMLKEDFLSSVDITLILNEEVAELRRKGLFILEDDLETSTARRLRLQTETLPRGIFITRKKCLVNEADAVAIQEFCEKYNERVESYKQSPEATAQFKLETPHDIPLYTYDRASIHDLDSIKTFAETYFFGNQPFSWDYFAYEPLISRDKALSAVSELGKCLDTDKRKSMSERDATRIGAEIKSLEATLSSRLTQQDWWLPADFYRLVEKELGKISPAAREGISTKLLPKVYSDEIIELNPNV